jgi:flagellar biosynthesis GTPase FlhF
VLSVGSDLKDLVLLCANYLLIKPTGIAFSKFDETTQPGKVFSILDVISLPVVCFSDGKRVFVDIAKGDPQYMYDKIFESPTRNAE